MRQYNLIVIYILILFFQLNIVSAEDLNQETKQEYLFLKALLNEGSANTELYLRLSEISPHNAESLCYARLGLLLSPKNIQLKQQVDKLRGAAKINELKLGDKSPIQSPSLLIFQNFIPKHQLLILLFTASSLSLLVFLSRYFVLGTKRGKKFQLLLHGVSLLFFVQIFLITKTKDGRYRLVNSIEDINKLEGVVLEETIVYSSPTTNSQQVNIIKPSSEINLYPNTETNPWILIETNDKRRGWIEDIKSICQINSQ